MLERLIGYANTNSNGVAKLDYTGKGVGELDLIAKLHSDDTITSNNYSLLDCLFVGTGKTTGWYGGLAYSTDVTLEEGVVKWTVPSTQQYLGYYLSNATYLANKTVKTDVQITFTKNIRLACYYHNGTSWSLINSVQVNMGTNSTATLTVTVPSDCTRLWSRFQSNSSTELLETNDKVYVNNFEVYISKEGD